MHGGIVIPDCDPFDPRYLNFLQDDDVCRLYGDDNAQTFALLDRVDYEFFQRWRWSWKFSRPDKYYLRRTIRPEGVRGSRCASLLLHVEIMKRTGIEPPTWAHRLVDHRDGDSKNCRRKNLRWATDGMNARNIRGCASFDLMEG